MIKAEWTNKDSLDLQPTCNQLATTEGELISREGAIECIRWGESVTDVIDRINALPSAEPKTGEWIRCKEQDKADLENGNALYECSNCGHTDLHAETQEVPYCWFCGSDMRGDKNG